MKTQGNWTKTSAIILLITFAGILLTSCQLQQTIPSTETPAANSPSPETKYYAKTVFFVNTPENDESNSEIYLAILDEVTGLALNAKLHRMDKVESNLYQVEIDLPVGTIVKYRYSRKDKIFTNEHLPNGDEVRYRLHYVTGPAEVKDTISRWTDTLYEGTTGRFSGIVVNANTGEPIPDIMVCIGGYQAYSDANGLFYIENIPPGEHNAVFYAIDGSYQPYEQGAIIQAGSNTPANVELQPNDFVDVAFLVSVPEDTTPGVPIKLAGNMYQFGNTFANLAGGVNTIASRMPILSLLPDGRYGIILSLPVGADIRYKYTLGDGFWNAEVDPKGNFILREFIVPDHPIVREDTVESFHSPQTGKIIFDITVPDTTPKEDDIYIQFNPYGWTEPVPMWKIGDNRWAFVLTSPLNLVDRFGYRVCRAGQCGVADDARTIGEFTSGQVIEPSAEDQLVVDAVEQWAWLDTKTQYAISPPKDINLYDNYVLGVELQARYEPSWLSRYPYTFKRINSLHANTIVLTPNWIAPSNNPPLLYQRAGESETWHEISAEISYAKQNNLAVYIKPSPLFSIYPEDWWVSGVRDFAWWVTWFDQYTNFILHFAKIAETQGIEMFIIGGDWVKPALPKGTISPTIPSGVPADAEQRWRTLIQKVREIYHGTLGWELAVNGENVNAPPFIDDVDQIYVSFTPQLSESNDPDINELLDNTAKVFEDKLYPLWLGWSPNIDNTGVTPKPPILVAITFPSADGAITGCIEDPILTCINPKFLNYPAPDYPTVGIDLKEQAKIYHAVISVINRYDWVGGVISQGYYQPTALTDLSISVHGKPAEEVIEAWFRQLNK